MLTYTIEHRDGLGRLLYAWSGDCVREAHGKLRELMHGLFPGDFVVVLTRLREGERI